MSHVIKQEITILPVAPLKKIPSNAKILIGNPKDNENFPHNMNKIPYVNMEAVCYERPSKEIELSEFKKVLLEEIDSFLNGFKQDSKRPPDYVYTVKHINNGYCADFAHAVWERFNRSDDIQATDDEELGGREYTHTFICFEDRYYDAECVDGVDDWTQLPIFLDDEREVMW